MKTPTKLAVAFVAIAGVAGAALAAQADSRWHGRDGGPGAMYQHMQEAHGDWHHGMRDDDRGPRLGRLFRMLDTFDSNEDGKVTQAEIDAMRGDRLVKFDADGDKSLTLQEYQALWLDAMRERMVDRFQELDADGDGKVTVEEFQDPYAKTVRRMDRNEDGVIDRNDFGRSDDEMGPGMMNPGQMGPGQMRGPMMPGSGSNG